MKAYWIALYKRIDSQENLKNYGSKVTEIIKSYGGKPLVRGGKFETLEGETYPRTVIWEFPDEQAQRTIEKLIEEHISKFTKTLSPKTITFSGERKMELKS